MGDWNWRVRPICLPVPWKSFSARSHRLPTAGKIGGNTYSESGPSWKLRLGHIEQKGKSRQSGKIFVAAMTGKPLLFYQCHCSRCRRARSAAHGANLFYKLEQFRWLRGESLVVEYKPPEAERFGVAFCRECGGAVPRVRAGVVAPASALDTDPGMRPMAHIYVGSKAPWFEIRDAIPQLDGVPPPPR